MPMRNQGFTLLELSIVIVIVGLLAGGITVGREVIHNAQLRSFISEVESYKTAIHHFNEKYGWLPGDIPTATNYWKRADGGADLQQNCANPETDIHPTDPLATCNGNGTGAIGGVYESNSDRNTEAYRVWQHLANAGLIDGRYTGVGTNCTSGCTMWRVATPGVNVPTSWKEGGFFLMEDYISSMGDPANNTWNAGFGTGSGVNNRFTYLHYGRKNTTGWPWSGLISSKDSFEIDFKMDDGKPGLGKVVCFYSSSCGTTRNTETSVYRKNDWEGGLMFRM